MGQRRGRRAGAGGVYLTAAGQHNGQVATGTFVASASGVQTFMNLQHPASGSIPETHNACQAIQVRDLTPQPLAPRATYYGLGTPGTNTQPLLGGTRCSPGITFVGHPVMGAPVLLTAENSQDLPSWAAVVISLDSASQPLLAGTLLVDPTVAATLVLPMPQPVSPYVHDHELQIPLTVPSAPSMALYFQVLQLDPNAAGGVSMTAGIEAVIGL